MSNYNFEPKSKNDVFDKYEKAKNDYQYVQPERGGCLTTYLVFTVGINILLLFLAFFAIAELSTYRNSMAGMDFAFALFQIVINICVVMCIYGLWNWQEWGYKGLLIIYVLLIAFNLITEQLPTAGGTVIDLAILYFLMQNKTQHLK